jgi:hypothetical protein
MILFACMIAARRLRESCQRGDMIKSSSDMIEITRYVKYDLMINFMLMHVAQT